MIFFGVDPGTATTGYGIVETAGTSRYHVAHGVIRTPSGLLPAPRLKMIYDALTGLFRRYQPDIVAVEELFFSTNAKTAMTVAEARGVIMLCAADFGAEILSFTPNRVKQSVTQNGRAEKRDVQNMVKMLLALPDIPRPDDAADALAIALCATQEPRWLSGPFRRK